MPQQIYIQSNDRYLIGNFGYWRITIGNVTHRDIPINPKKILKYQLVELLQHAGFTEVSNLPKAQLLQMFLEWYVFV